MSSIGGDLLDRIARHSARASVRAARESEGSVGFTGEGFSRATAVRLAVAGTVSLALGEWGAPARADDGDLGTCLEGCLGGVDDWLKEQERACLNVFAPKSFYQAPGWRKFRELFRAGPFSAWKDLVQGALAGACVMQQQSKAKEMSHDCLPDCRKRCGSRAVQSSGSSRQVCKPPPPPKNTTPVPPPPPNSSEDPCLASNTVGGQCCGPFTSGAGGVIVPCACATPGVGCERYGCG